MDFQDIKPVDNDSLRAEYNALITLRDEKMKEVQDFEVMMTTQDAALKERIMTELANVEALKKTEQDKLDEIQRTLDNLNQQQIEIDQKEKDLADRSLALDSRDMILKENEDASDKRAELIKEQNLAFIELQKKNQTISDALDLRRNQLDQRDADISAKSDESAKLNQQALDNMDLLKKEQDSFKQANDDLAYRETSFNTDKSAFAEAKAPYDAAVLKLQADQEKLLNDQLALAQTQHELELAKAAVDQHEANLKAGDQAQLVKEAELRNWQNDLKVQAANLNQ